MNAKKIFIIGSINTDLAIQTPKMPQKGETITGSGFFIAQGGKGANQAVAAARLGGDVAMCGCVGTDDFGKAALDSLNGFGVKTQFVHKKGDSTGIAVIVLTEGDNRIVLNRGANALLSSSDIDEALKDAKAGDIYLTQLENPIDIIGYGLQKAKEKGMYVMLNPAPANKDIEKYLSYVDMILPNETELEILTGESDYEKGAVKIPVPEVLVTLGSRGQYYHSNERSFRCESIKIKPVDTTAAGDTFCGALATRLALGVEMKEAIMFAGKAASIACTRQGAQPSIPTIEEIEKY